ncbi:hypothetical protein KC19_VG075200 [Ceratodon purpureus]|uniref:Uncharacterized protein n=1 Tax=Ceratodon purpureus TaxID=3225 RepID=A0A8T0HMZ6_CERPU|nr:hypothetical protein KC19_VG075200 [Ceratodon purpureus]
MLNRNELHALRRAIKSISLSPIKALKSSSTTQAPSYTKVELASDHKCRLFRLARTCLKVNRVELSYGEGQ